MRVGIKNGCINKLKNLNELNIKQFKSKQLNTPTRYLIQLINGVIGLSTNLSPHQQSWGFPRLSFIILDLFQMSKNGTTFIINLVKLPNGYSFQSVTEGENNANKKKNNSKDKSKPNPNKQIHRIFRELALDPQQPQELLNPILEEPEPTRKLIEPEIEEDFSVQIKRENGLPQSPATWFDQTTIHQIQKDSLPQFFDGRSYKTPELYQKYRNFMITLHRKNPTEYLTKIACRRILRGDVNTIMKIHTFLQKQGVINFCISKQGNYTFVPSMFSRVINQQSKYGVGVDKFVDTDEQKTVEPIDMTNITITTVNKCFSKSNRVFCSKCDSICGIIWYRRKDQAQKNQILCVDCLKSISETEAEEYTKADIIKKIDTSTQDNKAVWSIDDNLKLLNFSSKPTENWQRLQNSFQKKKTFDDIMLQFMQFPIGNFDPLEKKQQEPVIQDKHQYHINKLLERYKSSPYSKKANIESQSKDLSNQKFTKNMLQLTKSLCIKFQTAIKTNLQIENSIDSTLFQLKNLRTLTKKTIQNQLPLVNEKIAENGSQYGQRSQASDDQEQQQQYNENDHEDQDQQENVKDVEIQDYINFSYN